MKAKAILIIGMPGSGKDEFAMVAREMGLYYGSKVSPAVHPEFGKVEITVSKKDSNRFTSHIFLLDNISM